MRESSELDGPKVNRQDGEKPVDSRDPTMRLLCEQQTILNNGLDGIAYLKHRHIVFCNRRMNEIFGYLPGELIGQSTEILYASRHIYLDVGIQAYAQCAAGKTQSDEVLMRRKDGQTFWGNLRGQAIDPQSANNTASTSTSVIAQADLVIALSATPAQALANQPLSFVATSTNNGPADAQDVAITLTLSADLRYSSHTAAGANCTTPQVGTTGTIVCTWPGATAPGGVRTLTLLAYSNNEGSMSVAASTASPTTDPVPNNNAQSAAVTVGLPFTEIPSLNQTGLLLLTLLTALAGVLAVRRQR